MKTAIIKTEMIAAVMFETRQDADELSGPDQWEFTLYSLASKLADLDDAFDVDAFINLAETGSAE